MAVVRPSQMGRHTSTGPKEKLKNWRPNAPACESDKGMCRQRASASERKKMGKKLHSLEQKAKEALVAEAGRSDGAAAAAEAVTAVVALCGERHKTLDEEFAPQLATAQDAVLAACPSLSKTLDDYVEHSKSLQGPRDA